MKNRVILTLLVVVLAGLWATAENPKAWGRKSYFNISWVDQTLENKNAVNLKGENLRWKSDYGVALTKGTTYYLHSKPLFGMLKFGIDWTQIDVNYAKLIEDNFEVIGVDEDGFGLDKLDLGKHQIELAMHVGPSITLNPVDHLKINGYFRYAPSFSGLIFKDLASETQIGYGYGSFFVAGGAISWKLISLGAEYRWGSGKYNNMSFNLENADADIDLDGSSFDAGDIHVDLSDVFNSSKQKMKTSSLRVYVSLRF